MTRALMFVPTSYALYKKKIVMGRKDREREGVRSKSHRKEKKDIL